jgi:hypothetical protein
MSFNSVYTHNPLPTSIFGRQATTYTSSLSNTSPTTSTSPYYHPPLVLEHHSHQTMAQKGTLPNTQWYPGSTSAMMSSSFAPYQSSNGSSKLTKICQRMTPFTLLHVFFKHFYHLFLSLLFLLESSKLFLS